MTLDNETIAREYPRLFHMAEPGAWPSIRKHGLLSTTSLLDLFEIERPRRKAIEAQHRPQSIQISHPTHGTAVVRDQKPMSDSALRKCLLDGLAPSDWYRLLNRHVFFWLSRQRLDRLLGARAYRQQRHTILEVDTLTLLDVYAKDVVLAPINSGSTIMNPQPRGRATFQPIGSYPYEEWRRKRGRRDAIVELAIRGGVEDIERFVLRVTEEGAGSATKVLHEGRRRSSTAY